MALSTENKEKVYRIIFERAYEIEQQLSDDDFFLAKMCGLSPYEVSDASLRIAVMELQKEFNH